MNSVLIRVDVPTRDKLKSLAAGRKMSMADVLRQLVRAPDISLAERLDRIEGKLERGPSMVAKWLEAHPEGPDATEPKSPRMVEFEAFIDSEEQRRIKEGRPAL